MDGLRLAKVIRFHPEAHAADLLFLHDGSRVPMVQAISPSASTNSGLVDMPEPDQGPGDDWDPRDSNTRDVIAVVAYFQTLPIIIGYLFPQVAQCLFNRANFKVERHPSDVYTTVDNDGNVEVYHPSGTYFRIGTSPAHEDLTGQDFDGKWAIEKNTDKAVHVRLRVANAGVQKGLVEIDPSGNGNVDLEGNLTADVSGSANVTVGNGLIAAVTGSTTIQTTGDMNLQAGGDVNISAAGNVNVDGTQFRWNGG